MGQKICVDESMILYTGHAIPWTQYMPNKPIKHGIKVWALCCARTGYLYNFAIYTGRSNVTESASTPIGVIDKLLDAPDAWKPGRIMYTDNWYTSLDLMRHL